MHFGAVPLPDVYSTHESVAMPCLFIYCHAELDHGWGWKLRVLSLYWYGFVDYIN